MKQQRPGKIITVSSVAGTAPSADGSYAHYEAAKAAIAHYTRYLAQDLGPCGITANCIAPGVIATGRIMQTVIPGSSQSNRDRAEFVALRRLGMVEDRAKVVEFLATDLSDYVAGAVSRSMADWCADSHLTRTRRVGDAVFVVDRIIEHGPDSVLDAESQPESQAESQSRCR
jgi:NAD(P)-dependent dehydrogenase (short-subunit alcohol dehydrogenase family)